MVANPSVNRNGVSAIYSFCTHNLLRKYDLILLVS